MLQKVRIGVLADLGENVMDNAVVEAAAYTYEKSEPTGAAAFIRALHEEDRKQAIHNSIWDLANGRLDRNTFFTCLSQFNILSGSPLVYWLSRQAMLALA